MTTTSFEKLRYPIGQFKYPVIVDSNLIKTWISDIETLPSAIEMLVFDLSVDDLNLPYRPQGWTIKQVIHHLADSHMNAFIRFKLALTEELPVIKPYEEDKWAKLDDGTHDDIIDSLSLLKHLHAKWARLLKTLSEEDLKRAYIHPEHSKRFELKEALGMYSWHCNHHLQHIKQAMKFNGTF